MAIPSSFIDELVSRADIVDVVSDYMSLNPKGGSYWGLCPFHGEKSPSFHVRPDRQSYHCFGCGKGGGVISFVMETENLPFIDAVGKLAQRYHMVIPEESQDERSGYRKKLLEINKEAARFFHKCLYEEKGKEALGYLTGRGLSKGTLTKFGLGYSPNAWDGLILALKDKGYEKKDLLDAGLAVAGKNGSIYDRFRDRVMFPIIDIRGNVVGFGGRVMGDGTPKYLNSSDSFVFNKSNTLFALNLAKTTKGKGLILTEGYMDTIALHQAGFDGAVASLGTAFTPQHAKLISRFASEVVIAFDSDEAGVNAANRAIPFLEKAGLQVKVLKMKGAKDPDEYIKSFGRESFLQLLDGSEDHITHSLGELQKKYDLDNDMEKVQFLKDAAGFLSSLTSPVEREVYAYRVAETTKIDKEVILGEIARAMKRNLATAKKKELQTHMLPGKNAQPKQREFRYENIKSARAEEGILRLLVLEDSLFPLCQEMQSADFSAPVLGKIFAVMKDRYFAGASLQLGSLAENLSGEELSHLSGILEQPENLSSAKESLRSYQGIIAREKLGAEAIKDDDFLLAKQKRLRDSKGLDKS